MENTGSRKAIAVIVAIIAIGLIIWGFYYSYNSNRANGEVFNPALESTRGNDEDVRTVDVRHQYKDGVHTYAGEIDLGTPCDTVDVEASLSDGTVNLDFQTSSTSEVCAQVITARRFKATVSGPENVSVMGTLNGESIRLNIFEVPLGEDLDDFEINTKG